MSKRKAEDDVEDDAAKKGKSASISDPDSYMFVQIDNVDDNSPTIFYIKHKTVEESHPDWPEVVEQLSSGKLLGAEFQCLDEGRIFKFDGSIEKGKELLVSKGFNYDEDLKLSDNEEGDDGSEDDSEEGEDDEGEDDDDDEEGDEEGEEDDDDDDEGEEDDDDDEDDA